MNKTLIAGIIIGACITITAVHTYFFYQLNKIVATDHATLMQVVQFIQNNQAQAGQSQASTTVK